MFAKAGDGGDGTGYTKAGKGVKIMAMVDANGPIVAGGTTSASPHERRLAQQLAHFVLPTEEVKGRWDA